MQILVQYEKGHSDRDSIGIANALAKRGHQVSIWDPLNKENNILEAQFELAIFNDYKNLGFSVKKACQGKKAVFLKTKVVHDIEGVVIESVPPCADESRFPPTYYDKEFANDVFLYTLRELSELELDILREVNQLGVAFKIIGANVPLSNYIGNTPNPTIVTKLARSSKVCIDFDLMCAYDLAKIGCNVITNSENAVGLPVFNEGNFLEVLSHALANKLPIINPYENLIMPYTQFVEYLGEIVGENL